MGKHPKHSGGMLVLTRYPGETIVIPELGITIAITSVAGNRASVGIDLHRSIDVLRSEVWERLKIEDPDRAGRILARRESFETRHLNHEN